MKLKPMSENMRERVNKAIRWQLAKDIEITRNHVDQAITGLGARWGGGYLGGFAAYTPWGIASIEAAFLDRMVCPAAWDSRTLIRQDICSCPHLHSRIKRRLLRAHEKADWARWHDSFYAGRIMALEPGQLRHPIEKQIRRCRHLSRASRANLLVNLYPVRHAQA